MPGGMGAEQFERRIMKDSLIHDIMGDFPYKYLRNMYVKWNLVADLTLGPLSHLQNFHHRSEYGLRIYCGQTHRQKHTHRQTEFYDIRLTLRFKLLEQISKGDANTLE